MQWSVRDNTAEFQGQSDTVVGRAPDRMESSPVSIALIHRVPALTIAGGPGSGILLTYPSIALWTFTSSLLCVLIYHFFSL